MLPVCSVTFKQHDCPKGHKTFLSGNASVLAWKMIKSEMGKLIPSSDGSLFTSRKCIFLFPKLGLKARASLFDLILVILVQCHSGDNWVTQCFDPLQMRKGAYHFTLIAMGGCWSAINVEKTAILYDRRFFLDEGSNGVVRPA